MAFHRQFNPTRFPPAKTSMKNPVNNMNIFEDLIDELKEENLIEETVIQTSRARKNKETSARSENETVAAAAVQTPFLEARETVAAEELVAPAAPTLAAEISADATNSKPSPAKTLAVAETEPVSENDFYRRRALEEVAFLQMVESAFGGVERDQMKIAPTFYDDLEVKKVLHSFLQLSPKASAAEHSQGEFRLLQATEGWYSTLAHRDRRMMAAHLRRYCETSRPPLSMPALIALARFYRNSPYSEAVRSKFDLMMTRIFSQEIGGSQRELGFSREELVGYIKELYAEWSSVPMYSTDADDEGIRQTVGQFDEFTTEANAADNFDALINNNFFNRLRIFKESANEDFYAPPVAAAGIELNVKIGNRYVELLEREREKEGIEAVEHKYGAMDDSAVSETTGRTMSLVELLSRKSSAPESIEDMSGCDDPSLRREAGESAAAVVKNKSLNIWIIIALAAAIIAFGTYFVVGATPPENMTNGVIKHKSELK